MAFPAALAHPCHPSFPPPALPSYVFCSILHCDKHPEVPLMNIKHCTEQYLAASGLNYTIFRLCGFMQVGQHSVVPLLAGGAGVVVVVWCRRVCCECAARCRQWLSGCAAGSAAAASRPCYILALAVRLALLTPLPPLTTPSRPSSATTRCPSWRRSRCGAPPTRRAPPTSTRRWGQASLERPPQIGGQSARWLQGLHRCWRPVTMSLTLQPIPRPTPPHPTAFPLPGRGAHGHGGAAQRCGGGAHAAAGGPQGLVHRGGDCALREAGRLRRRGGRRRGRGAVGGFVW